MPGSRGPAWWHTRKTEAGWDTRRRGQRADPTSGKTATAPQGCSPWEAVQCCARAPYLGGGDGGGDGGYNDDCGDYGGVGDGVLDFCHQVVQVGHCVPANPILVISRPRAVLLQMILFSGFQESVTLLKDFFGYS